MGASGGAKSAEDGVDRTADDGAKSVDIMGASGSAKSGEDDRMGRGVVDRTLTGGEGRVHAS